MNHGSAPEGDLNLARQCLDAALRLHRYVAGRHWDGAALIGPDPGIRLNYRIGRFIKSYLSALTWNDSYYYLQAQGYWVLANWRLFACTGHEGYREMAVQCSHSMQRRQRADGAWIYPNREWQGRIATAEGSWGSLGLLESYRQTGAPEFLDGALRWHRFLLHSIGFQSGGEELAVNYFAGRSALRVPNNSAFVLRLLAELADLNHDASYLKPCGGLLTFLRHAQKGSGELPYALGAINGNEGRPHFQCYQYNAFQCLDLLAYHRLTADLLALDLARGVLRFLREGLAEDGHALYQCGNGCREVTYHTAALAAAFSQAARFGIAGYARDREKAFEYLLGLQRPDGSFSYSRRDYGVLQDRRSYPRYLAMILYHLLLHAGQPGLVTLIEEQASGAPQKGAA